MNQNTSSTTPQGGDDSTGPLATLLVIERETTTSAYRAVDDSPVPIPAPVRWLLGALIGAAALAGLTVVTVDRIESELVRRTDRAIERAGLDPESFEVDFDFRNGTVSGRLPEGWTPARFHADIAVDGANDLVFAPDPSPTS